MSLLLFIDLAGILAFAISGATAAFDKKLDIFGAVVIALITALGGGTLRDLLIGSTPVAWLANMHALFIVVFAVVLVMLFKKYMVRLRRTFFVFDTLGIGLFTVLGTQKALDFGLNPAMAMLMGVMSAVFGGVLRDTLCNEIPLIFRKEVYATACLAGSAAYIFMSLYVNLPVEWATWIAISTIVLIRILAVKYKWSLPVV